jgi:hypothetical protein
MRLRFIFLAASLTLLAACDQLGIESPQKELERKEADAKAVGSACRQAGRAIEDCYNLNPKAAKASVFGGWREMDEYMRENKLEVVAPTVPPPAGSKPKVADEETDMADSEPGDKKADHKSTNKAADKVDKGEKTAEKTADKTAHRAKPKADTAHGE